MPIQLLRPEVSSKIAAGEVIERPASAVKELVENALDAGASRIRLDIRGGGIEYISVTDDGGGIPPDQAELAFRRFATSKLASADDLQAVSTLGFRGEALPSIAAIARVELRTRPTDADVGTVIELEEGAVQSIAPAGAPPGTRVVLRHLFRNLPARRKFLRTASAEQRRIHIVVAHYAMAYPHVAFELTVDKGRGFASPGSGDLRDAVAAVHTRKVAEQMLEITPDDAELGDGAITVSGLIGPPSLDRANRSYISLFANRRWVQNRSLSYAIEQAYHGFMAERRYPVAVLCVDIPFEEVDVNAHPAKAEIRFRRENRVFGAVQRAVRRTLAEFAPVPQVNPRAVSHPHAPAPTAPNPSAFWPTAPFSGGASPNPPSAPAAPAPHAPITNYRGIITPSDDEATADPQTIPAVQPATPGGTLPILRVLGQVQNTYLIAEGPDGMYMIDQHAAHERIVFERTLARAAAGTPEVQSLLEPAVVELDPAGMELVKTRADAIAGMGFILEAFGENSVIIRGVPSLLHETDHAAALSDVLDLMQDGGGFETWEERAAYSIACHGAIRAGKTLSPDEMRELTRQLEACAQPNSCPHGRPTMIHMSAYQLASEFGRT